MPLTLEEATIDDVPALTDVYMQAFQLPITLATFPRIPSVRAWWEAQNREALISDQTVRFVKIIDADNIIAYAKWIFPPAEKGAASGGDDPDAMPEWPEGSDKALCDNFYGGLAREHKRIMGDRPHYHLEMLATLPEHQGKGAAGHLIRWGLEKADRDGLEAYLDASPKGAPIYERFGWQVAGRVEALEGRHTDLCMRRPALGERAESRDEDRAV